MGRRILLKNVLKKVISIWVAFVLAATAIPTSALAFVGGRVASESATTVASEGRSGYISKSAKGSELANDYGAMKSYSSSGRKSGWLRCRQQKISGTVPII